MAIQTVNHIRKISLQLLSLKVSILALLLFCFSTYAQAQSEKRDTIFLHNSEVLVGEIKEMNLGKVTIDSKNVGLINIKESKIRTISTTKDSMRIETIDKMLYYGYLKPSEQDGMVYIVTSWTTRLASISEISEMVSLRRNFFRSVRGNASAGFSFSHSSGIGQLTSGANLTFVAKQFELDVSLSTIASIDTASFSRDREDVSFTGYYNLKSKSLWYVLGMVNYQRNLELGVSRRFQETVGGGRKLILSKYLQAQSLLGVNLGQEWSTSDGKESLLVEIPLGFTLNFFKFSEPNIQLSSQNVFYTSLTQSGRLRFDSSTSISWELVHDFSLSLSFYFDYDRRPPDSQKGKTDYGTVIGLTYQF